MEISANDLTRTVLCDQPGCPFDAETGTTRCREHANTTGRQTPRTRPNAYAVQQIILAIQRWADEHDGVPPRSSDWHRSGDYWPNMTTVVRHFGKWSAGLEAAGFSADFHIRRRWAVPEREPQTDGQALEAAAPSNPRATPPVSTRPPAAAESSRSGTAERVRASLAVLRAEIDELERELLDDLLAERYEDAA